MLLWVQRRIVGWAIAISVYSDSQAELKALCLMPIRFRISVGLLEGIQQASREQWTPSLQGSGSLGTFWQWKSRCLAKVCKGCRCLPGQNHAKKAHPGSSKRADDQTTFTGKPQIRKLVSLITRHRLLRKHLRTAGIQRGDVMCRHCSSQQDILPSTFSLEHNRRVTKTAMILPYYFPTPKQKIKESERIGMQDVQNDSDPPWGHWDKSNTNLRLIGR